MTTMKKTKTKTKNPLSPDDGQLPSILIYLFGVIRSDE